MTRIAVVVTDRRVAPPRRGNQVRILGVLRGLRALGWRVQLISPHAGSDQDLRNEVDWVYRVRARPFGGGDVSNFDCRPYRRAVERVAAARRPKVVITEYAWLAPSVFGLPKGVRRIVDCHDVLHERTNRFVAAGLDPWVRCTWDQERDLLRCVDMIVTGQLHDRDTLQALLPDKQVKCVFPEIDVALASSAPAASRHVLAVGASHAGNDGILRFAARAWPAVPAAVDDAQLDVVGSVTRAASLPGVNHLGEVHDLTGFYCSAAVVVCPVEVGSGVKIKMIEALRHGKAIVATPAAVEGLPVPEKPAWVEVKDISGFAEAVLSLLSDSVARVRLEDQAARYARQHLAPGVIHRDLDAALARPRSLRRWFPGMVAVGLVPTQPCR